MNYLVLARKYRPQNFSDIVGQEHIVTILKNAIKAGQIWHAYIFSGTRGTGKTSTARILAKTLNCHSLTETFEPCNKCESCVEITNGSSVDVIEIDAASNRGIDEIRALRENVKFAPVKSKYKIYIIDEAHQITDQAFNAFLKTLEEPPPYVIFIMATTEFQAFPLTIISRCQVFQFRPVDTKTIFERLKYIISKENKNVKVSDEVLEIISQNSGGSIRDAISLLDQVLSFTDKGVVDIEMVKKMLGVTSKEILEEFIDTVLSGEAGKIISCIEKMYSNGIDFVQFSKDLIESYRAILFEVLGLDSKNNLIDAKKYKEQFNLTKLIANIQTLMKLLEDIKRTEYPKIILELYGIKLTKQYIDMDQLINLAGTSTSSEINKTNYNIESERNDIKLNKEQINNLHTDEKDINTTWEKFLEKIKLEKPLTYNSVLLNSEVSLRGDVLIISLPNNHIQAIAKKHIPILEETLKNYFGRNIKVETVVQSNIKKVVLGKETEDNIEKDEIKTIPLKPKKVIDPEVEKFIKSISGKVVGQNQSDVSKVYEIKSADNDNNSEEKKDD
ncbi:MAG: DNA polymerase III subunit gamma/tau [Endomicrobiia bacterium]